jgi:hypothetical protein
MSALANWVVERAGAHALPRTTPRVAVEGLLGDLDG